MELDLYPINITDKMFKNKIMFNEAPSAHNKMEINQKNNKSLERMNDSGNQDLQILSIGNMLKSTD